MDAAPHFAQTYAEARAKFLEAAEAAGADLQSHPHPMLGREGEPLAMDVARYGARDAKAVLLISSACHGAEGFCGSGVQVALLRDAAFQRAAADAGVALLYVHGLNPYGFSWLRRTTHENVDLNRNFHDFSRPLPHNADYDEIAALVVPADWPPTPENRERLGHYLQTWGEKRLQAAISGGQYDHPDGLFYGGRNPTWSHQTVRHVLQEHGARCERLGWIDVHTGLGPSGHGERINASGADPAAIARTRAWWGKDVTALEDGSSSSAPLKGMMWQAALEECPQAEYTGIALEYGTLPILEVIEALRADQWLEMHPEAPAEQRDAIKRQVRDTFYIDTDAWKRQILEQAFEAAHQALAGLSRR